MAVNYISAAATVCLLVSLAKLFYDGVLSASQQQRHCSRVAAVALGQGKVKLATWGQVGQQPMKKMRGQAVASSAIVAIAQSKKYTHTHAQSVRCVDNGQSAKGKRKT